MNWITLSIIGLFSLSVMSTLITLMTRKGFPVSFVLLTIGVTLTVFYFIETFVISGYKLELDSKTLLMFIVIGLLSAIGNLAIYQAAKVAPNAGLAISIAGMQGAIVSVLALIFLKDKLSLLQIVGLILAVVAITLINVGSNAGASRKNQDKTSITQVN